MSSETLSQSEIDNLLRRGSSAATAPAANAPAMDVQIYDFRRPSRVSKEKLRTLESMYERLVKSLEGWLIGRVRGQIELQLQSIEPFSFGEFIFSLPTPCASYLFDIADSGGQQGVIDIGHEFAYFLVDRFFGGGSGNLTSMDRSLTPIERTHSIQLQKAVDVWAALGCRVVKMTPESHDAAFAAVSHLPHLIAFAMMNAISGQPMGRDFLSLAGPGFRDFSRIAASEPAMWRDIMMSNREELLAQSKIFQRNLQALELMIANGNEEALLEQIENASEVRANWSMAKHQK